MNEEIERTLRIDGNEPRVVISVIDDTHGPYTKHGRCVGFREDPLAGKLVLIRDQLGDIDEFSVYSVEFER